MAMQGLKPGNSVLKFEESLPLAFDEIGKVTDAAGTKIENLRELLPHIKTAKRGVRAEFEAMVGPGKQLMVDGNPVAVVPHASISVMRE